MRLLVGHGRGDHRRAGAPPPARLASPQIHAVQRPAGRAHQELVVERGEARGDAAQRRGPDRLAGQQRQRHGAAVGQAEIQVVERGRRRHVSHRAERRSPQQLAISGAKGRQIAAFERQDQPARVPIGRRGHRAGQDALPDHRAGARAQRPHAAGDHHEHQVTADGHRPAPSRSPPASVCGRCRGPRPRARRRAPARTRCPGRRRAAPRADGPRASSSARRARRRAAATAEDPARWPWPQRGSAVGCAAADARRPAARGRQHAASAHTSTWSSHAAAPRYNSGSPSPWRAVLTPLVITVAHQTILVLDFGSQVTQLIARRVREAHVYSEVHPCDVSDDWVRAYAREHDVKGVILSGSHASTYEAAGSAGAASGVRTGRARARHLLRHVHDGGAAGRAGGGEQSSRVRLRRSARARPLGAARRHRGSSGRGRRPPAGRVDEPRRQGHGVAAWLRAHGLHAELPDRRHGRRRAPLLRGAVPSRSDPHAAGRGHPRSASCAASAARRPTGSCAITSPRRWRRFAPRSATRK